MISLVPGANAAVSTDLHRIEVTYSAIPNADIDVSAFLLASNGKVRGDGDMCFYGQKSLSGGSLRLIETSAGRAVFSLNLAGIDAGIERIALTATIYENRASFAQVSALKLQVVGALDVPISTLGMQETALILGEFYLRQGSWKFRCVAQGFAGGLEPLAQHFGIEIAAPAPAPTPPPAPAPVPTPAPTLVPKPVESKPKVSLSKITLDKTNSSISLAKRDEGFGEIKVNLNWNKGKSGGFFSRNKSIDLDVGCLFEMQDGDKGAVQALGNSFGDFNRKPFIQLMGDDRTGAVSDGEWLRINGKQWASMRRILIYAFIYEGAPNWAATDGVVTIYVPDQAPIEVRLNEEGGTQGMCAIAMLENVNGAVRVNRLVNFFKGHELMDKKYQWGMRWSAGSK